MIKICICDDDSAYRQKLYALLEGTALLGNAEYSFYDNGAKLISDYESGARFDLVFLDVDMPECSGIETGKHISSSDPKAIIIFVTSYPQYAIDAFECSAFHYLLKDCDPERFDHRHKSFGIAVL